MRRGLMAGVVAGSLTLGGLGWWLGARSQPATEPAVTHDDVEDAGAEQSADAAIMDAQAPAAERVLRRPRDYEGLAGFSRGEFTMGKRTLLAALHKQALGPQSMREAFACLKPVAPVNKVRARDTVRWVRSDADSTLTMVEFERAADEVYICKRDAAGKLRGERLPIVSERSRKTASLLVKTDLEEALRSAGFEPPMQHVLDEALSGRPQLTDHPRGLRMRLVYTEERVDGQFARYERIDALEAMTTKGTVVRVYAWPDKCAQCTYFDSERRHPVRGMFKPPIPLARVVSRFNMHRMHPVLHRVVPHTGVDYAGAPGTPIFAAGDGKVVAVQGMSGPCGNRVEISHALGISSVYCHLSRFRSGLKAGERVDQDDVIGYVGSTGRSTGPHLHFAVKRGGRFVDPLSLKMDGVELVPIKERAAFDALVARSGVELETLAWPDLPSDLNAPVGEEDNHDEGEELDVDAAAPAH